LIDDHRPFIFNCTPSSFEKAKWAGNSEATLLQKKLEYTSYCAFARRAN